MGNSPACHLGRAVKQASLFALVAGGGLVVAVCLSTSEARALCLPGEGASPCASASASLQPRQAQSAPPIQLGLLPVLPSAPGAAAAFPAPAAASAPVRPSITYSLGERDAAANPLPHAVASVNVNGAMSPMVRVRYRIDAAPASAPEPGDGLQIVIDSAAAGAQESKQAPGQGGGLPLAESSRTGNRPSLRSGEEEGGDPLLPLALLGGGVALVLSSRPRGSVRPGI